MVTLPYRFVVPLPIRHAEALDFSDHRFDVRLLALLRRQHERGRERHVHIGEGRVGTLHRPRPQPRDHRQLPVLVRLQVGTLAYQRRGDLDRRMPSPSPAAATSAQRSAETSDRRSPPMKSSPAITASTSREAGRAAVGRFVDQGVEAGGRRLRAARVPLLVPLLVPHMGQRADGRNARCCGDGACARVRQRYSVRCLYGICCIMSSASDSHVAPRNLNGTALHLQCRPASWPGPGPRAIID